MTSTVLIFYPIEKNNHVETWETLRSSETAAKIWARLRHLDAANQRPPAASPGKNDWAMQLSVLGHLCVGKIMGK